MVDDRQRPTIEPRATTSTRRSQAGTIFAVVERLLAVLGCVALVAMTLHIASDVLFRTFFDTPLPGTLEIVSNYYMVAVVFLPLALVQRSGGHIVAGLFTDSLPPRTRMRFDGVAALATAGVLLVLAGCALNQALHATSIGERLQTARFVIFTWPARWFVPVGFALMAVCALIDAGAGLVGRPARPARDG